MFETDWTLKDINTGDTDDLFERICKSRVESPMNADRLSSNDFHNPFLVNDMNQAVSCIVEHLEKQSRVCIHGDYDADGITSSYMLYDFLGYLGFKVDCIIPDRLDDGYGISMENAHRMIESGYKLVITADCGITAVDEIAYLTKGGIDVVVTDHHLVKDIFPDAKAVLCNTRKDNTYPFDQLCGAGMAFKLIHALCIELGYDEKFMDYIIPCTVGTVADMVPLTNENRKIVSMGLSALKNNKNSCFDSIIEVAGIDKGNMTTDDIGFIIGPRINAAGRMGDADLAFEILVENDYKESLRKAKKLTDLNNERKVIQDKTFKTIIDSVFNDLTLLDFPALIFSMKGLHKGVLGIVASRLVDMFHKPVILLSEENGICEGSGRSIEGFNLKEALDEAGDLLIGYGGHAMAAGLRLNSSLVYELRKRFSEILSKRILPVKTLVIDTLCRIDEIDTDSIEKIESLGPFGESNPGPVLAAEGVMIDKKRLVGKDGRHLSIYVRDESAKIGCICFNASAYEHLILYDQYYDIAFTPTINNYMGRSIPQARIVDIRISRRQWCSNEALSMITYIDELKKRKQDYNQNLFLRKLYDIGMCNTAQRIVSGDLNLSIKREDIKRIYTAIKSKGYRNRTKLPSDSLIVYITAIFILEELGIIEVDRYGLFTYDNIKINHGIKSKLENSLIYRSLTE